MSSSLGDVVDDIKPYDDPDKSFISLSKGKAQQVQECFEREKLYQEKLSDASQSFWVPFVIGAVAGLATGAIVTIKH